MQDIPPPSNNAPEQTIDGPLAPRSLSVGHGWSWLKTGGQMFVKSPLRWMLLMILWVLAHMGFSLLPVVGGLVQILEPLLAAGIMSACQRQFRDGHPVPTDLFNGLQHQTAPLLLAGVIYFGLMILIVIGLSVLTLAVSGLDLQALLADPEANFDPSQFSPLGVAIVLLVMVTCLMLLTMAIWFVPALIMLDQVPPVQAFKLSFHACLTNIRPFLLYGLIFACLTALAIIPMALGLLVLLPVFQASVYASYRDIFCKPDTPNTLLV